MITAYLEVGAIDENPSVTRGNNRATWKSHLEMVKVVFNIFILPYRPLQEFKAVSAPHRGPGIEEKLLKAYNYTQKAQCQVDQQLWS